MHIDGSRFQYLARVKSRLGDCYRWQDVFFVSQEGGQKGGLGGLWKVKGKEDEHS